MSRPKIIATVAAPGDCRYYKKGRSFVLGGFTPKGVCDSAYAALSRDAQTLRCGGQLPWQRNGRVLTRCPDPEGALWELRVEEPSDTKPADAEPAKVASAPPDRPTYQVDACRASEEECRFALAALSPLYAQVDTAIRESGWDQFLRGKVSGRPLSHQQLKVALAACPNCCTQPQIKDVGIIASLSPVGTAPSCTGCGMCSQICQENAIAVTEEQATFCRETCVSCGLCARECPADAIGTDGLRFQILVGGRLGRHPRFAEPLPGTLKATEVSAVVKRLLKTFIDNLADGERIGDVIQRLGLATIAREAIGNA